MHNSPKLGALLASLLFAGIGALRAQDAASPRENSPDEHRPRRDGECDPRSQLGLMADQKDRLKNLSDADRQSLLEARDKVHLAREILEAAIREHPEDEADIKAKAESLGQAMSSLLTLESVHRSKFLQILTAEQREAMGPEIWDRRPFGPPPPIPERPPPTPFNAPGGREKPCSPYGAKHPGPDDE